MRIKNLTQAALSLTLIFIFFMLFKGTTNILNSIFVPLVLYINISKFKRKEYIALVTAVLILTFLFFFQQIFFILFYALLGWVLHELFKRKRGFLLKTTVLTIVNFTGFIIIINITDLLLGTTITKALLSIGGGTQLGLVIVFFLEALFVALSFVIIIPRVIGRLTDNNR
ncbi:MAG: hypothetical protein R6V14_01075 [Halanaerobiales bacterium]